MPPPKRSRDERDAPHQRRQDQRHLYLIFDDWPWGYTIRELDLSPAAAVPPHQVTAGADRRRHRRRLPQPVISVEAPRGCPGHFAPAGTRIVAMHGRNQLSVPDGFLPIVDVRSRGVTFGPWEGYPHFPIYFAVGDDEIFALDTTSFKTLSLKPLWPPRLESRRNCQWSWCDLPEPPFRRDDVTSYALHPDGHTILVGTAGAPPEAAAATYAFDTAAAEPVWHRYDESTLLPFTGRVQFVDELNAFVGLSKDPAAVGRLCSVELAAPDGGRLGKEKLGRENMFSENPAERHVGATLVYMGGTEFCLVQCVSIGDTTSTADDGQQQLQEVVAQLREVIDAIDQGRLVTAYYPEEELKTEVQYTYRLMTFSVGYDKDGHLTTGDSCRLQRYKVPEEVTEDFFYHDPVAFLL
ncbi:unnamed protein product [Urochloa humidicola]